MNTDPVTRAGRIPPNSEEAERGVLGAMLINDTRVVPLAIRRGISEASFYAPFHRAMYEVILSLFTKRRPVDLLSVTQFLRDNNMIDQAGGNEYVERLINSTPTDAHAEYYIDIVRQKEILRGLIAVARETIEDAYEAGMDEAACDVVSRAQKKISSFVVRPQTASLKQAALAEIDRWESPTHRDSHLAWPWESMNAAIGPMTDEYTIIAAQPSVGKTSLVLNLLSFLADKGKTTSLLSLESKITKIAARIIAMRAPVNTFLLRTSDGTREDFYKARQVAETLDDLHIRVCDEGMNLEQIQAWAHAEKANGSSLLVIDNLRHIRVKPSAKKGFEVFAETSLQLKYIRDDTGLPLIAIHHLNAEDKLAWSADLERDADIILHLSDNEQLTVKPTRDNNYFSRYVMDVIGKKNREGRKGNVQLEFIKKYQRFVEYDTPTETAEDAVHVRTELFSQ